MRKARARRLSRERRAGCGRAWGWRRDEEGRVRPRLPAGVQAAAVLARGCFSVVSGVLEKTRHVSPPAR